MLRYICKRSAYYICIWVGENEREKEREEKEKERKGGSIHFVSIYGDIYIYISPCRSKKRPWASP